jgi:streptomycin 6-kinase
MPAPGRVLARRIDQLAEELGFDRVRIHGWGLAQAVLSMWWSVEDEGAFSEKAAEAPVPLGQGMKAARRQALLFLMCN